MPQCQPRFRRETNLSLGKAVTASGQSQTYGPANVIDGNQGSYWESTNHAFPQWIQIDLGADTSINRVVLKLPATWESRTQTLTVQGARTVRHSPIWRTRPTMNLTPTSGNSVTIRFDEASTRYVRLTVTSNTTWPARLSEFEIYGPSVSPPTPPTETISPAANRLPPPQAPLRTLQPKRMTTTSKPTGKAEAIQAP